MTEAEEEAKEIFKHSTLLADLADISEATEKIAQDISCELRQSFPIVVAVMNGGLLPLGLILTKLDFPLETDYVHPTRYDNSIQGGELKWVRKPPTYFADRTILLVDDVLDLGKTLEETVKECLLVGAKKVFTSVLIEKDVPRREGLSKSDFCGLKLPNRYLFGCGMDYKKRYRNAPGIFALPEDKT